MSDIVSGFYDRLVLRDLLGKVVPGSVVSLAAYAACLSSGQSPVATVLHLGQTPLGLWLVLVTVGWFVGFALQATGETLGIIRYYPRQLASPEFTRRLVDLSEASAQVRQGYERFVVVKEACGNAAVAIVVACALVGVRVWRGQPLGRGWLATLVLCNVDFGTGVLHHHACAPENPFDLQRRTERCSKLGFARAAGEPMRRVVRDWS